MKTQLYTILCYYLKKTGVLFNKSRLKQLITSHPYHNSLYAMVEVLEELNLENVALRTDIKGLLANGFPVIVFTAKVERKFIVVEDIVKDEVHYYDYETGCSIESLDTFANKWTGTALYAAQDEIQAELERKKIATEKHLLHWRTILSIIAGFACIVLWSVSITWTYTLISILSLCAFGLAVSILLAMHEFGESNRLLHKVCHLNRLTNCSEVLHSSASKLFGWLSMSDIGLCYFVGSIFSLLLAGVVQHLEVATSWLLTLALFSFPYTLFSLSYQIFIVKKMCPLCLGVIGVLWAKIALAIFSWNGLTFIPISQVTVLSLLAGFALPIVTWAYVKPLWKEYIRIRNYEYNYLRLKRTPEVISAMLSTEPTHSMDFIPDEIHLGSVAAPMHITVAMSLFCKPCGDSWKVLNHWLTTYPGLFWLTVRFSGYNSKNAKNTELIDALTGIYIQSGNDAFRKALTDWNENRDYQKWIANYYNTKPITPQPVSSKVAKWLQANFIPVMPTVFVGDQIYRYALSDLEYLLKEQYKIHDMETNSAQKYQSGKGKLSSVDQS